MTTNDVGRCCKSWSNLTNYRLRLTLNALHTHTTCLLVIIPPPQNVGGYTGFALSRRSVGRSVRLQFVSAL